MGMKVAIQTPQFPNQLLYVGLFGLAGASGAPGQRPCPRHLCPRWDATGYGLPTPREQTTGSRALPAGAVMVPAIRVPGPGLGGNACSVSRTPAVSRGTPAAFRERLQ